MACRVWGPEPHRSPSVTRPYRHRPSLEFVRHRARTNRSRDKRIYLGRGQIGAGTRGYTRGGDQSEQGQEDIPGAGTNRSRDKRIYGPIYKLAGPKGGGALTIIIM
eukprot:7631373-Pyramimonas_sp.AAC.1